MSAALIPQKTLRSLLMEVWISLRYLQHQVQ